MFAVDVSLVGTVLICLVLLLPYSFTCFFIIIVMWVHFLCCICCRGGGRVGGEVQRGELDQARQSLRNRHAPRAVLAPGRRRERPGLATLRPRDRLPQVVAVAVIFVSFCACMHAWFEKRAAFV